MHQQTLLRNLADALYRRQRRLYGGLAAKAAVEGDTEAVGFVAYVLQQLQSLGITVDEKRIGVPDADDFFQPLGQAHDG